MKTNILNVDQIYKKNLKGLFFGFHFRLNFLSSLKKSLKSDKKKLD